MLQSKAPVSKIICACKIIPLSKWVFCVLLWPSRIASQSRGKSLITTICESSHHFFSTSEVCLQPKHKVAYLCFRWFWVSWLRAVNPKFKWLGFPRKCISRLSTSALQYWVSFPVVPGRQLKLISLQRPRCSLWDEMLQLSLLLQSLPSCNRDTYIFTIISITDCLMSHEPLTYKRTNPCTLISDTCILQKCWAYVHYLG